MNTFTIFNTQESTH